MMAQRIDENKHIGFEELMQSRIMGIVEFRGKFIPKVECDFRYLQ